MSLELGVKACGVTSEADIRKAAKTGMRSVGVIVRPVATFPARSQGSYSQHPTRARQLREATPEDMEFVLLPRTKRLAEILTLSEEIRPDRVQLGETKSPLIPIALREYLDPNVKIAQVFHVDDATEPEVIDEYEGIDYVHLDSPGLSPGGNGVPHDWERSAAITERAHEQGKLVILAGGLTVVNAAEAIRIVQPDGLDVQTGIRAPGGMYSESLMRELVNAAA